MKARRLFNLLREVNGRHDGGWTISPNTIYRKGMAPRDCLDVIDMFESPYTARDDGTEPWLVMRCYSVRELADWLKKFNDKGNQ